MVAAVAPGLTTGTRLRMWWVRTEYWLARTLLPDVYANDALITFNNFHAFLDDPEFQRAYQRGARSLGNEDWYQWQWRVHVGLWAAASASKLEGDFVECGVSYGFLSSAIMEYLDWDRLGKTFYLLDTFAGLDPRFVTENERRAGALETSKGHLRNGMYVNGVDSVRANFAQWKNQRIIVGAVPETLEQVDAPSVAYLHIDMNCAPPRSRCAPVLLAPAHPGGLRAAGRLRQPGTRRAARRHGRGCRRTGCENLHIAHGPGPAHQAGTLSEPGLLPRVLARRTSSCRAIGFHVLSHG